MFQSQQPTFAGLDIDDKVLDNGHEDGDIEFTVSDTPPPYYVVTGRYAKLRKAILDMRPGQYLTIEADTKEMATKYASACHGDWKKKAKIKVKAKVFEVGDKYNVVIEKLRYSEPVLK